MKTHIPTPFMDLVRQHQNNVQSNIQKQLTTKDAASVTMSDWVMVHKVQKHLVLGNQRKAASYVAMRLEEDPAPLSDWAVEQMRKTPLKASKTQVAYTNCEGVPRAFDIARATA